MPAGSLASWLQLVLDRLRDAEEEKLRRVDGKENGAHAECGRRLGLQHRLPAPRLVVKNAVDERKGSFAS